jgi:hypothetical protein
VTYPACPKCGHAPLPANQASPAACPACGIVLAKFTAAAARATRGEIVDDAPAGGFFARWLFYVPAEIAKFNWYARCATLALFTLWTLWIWRDVDVVIGQAGSNFLHNVLLPFHEAGHYAIFRWFGRFIMTLGGTLGQHLMPIVLGVALLVKRRDAFGAAIFFWLLGFSVIDMGVYMYDADEPRLTLIGGKSGAESDGHDWINIFGDLGLLLKARAIGLFFGATGKVMMAAGLAWAAYMVWQQKENLSDSPLAETNEDGK